MFSVNISFLFNLHTPSVVFCREEALRDLACHRVDIFLTTWLTRTPNQKVPSYSVKGRVSPKPARGQGSRESKMRGMPAVHFKRHVLECTSFRTGSIRAEEKSYRQSCTDAGTPVLASYT